MRSSIPRVPHLPGSRLGQSDLVVDDGDLPAFLGRPVVVTEKQDGVALTIAFDGAGVDVAMKRDWSSALNGRILRAARRWVRVHERALLPFVVDGDVLYAEWLLHRLVTRYTALPSAVVFHTWRTTSGALVPRDVANAAFAAAGLAFIEPFFRGVIGERPLKLLLPARARFAPKARPEGFIVERVDDDGAASWAKWVAPHYRQPRGTELTGALNVVVAS
ncbi:MAG: RNA ligase family protein [Deltaproteobacteria bacterium]|nr:RNA ligase family protein [Deltaproteobacteria bacterium]